LHERWEGEHLPQQLHGSRHTRATQLAAFSGTES
jgi:hypothetical protein